MSGGCIDIAGPCPNADGPYPYRTLRPLVQQARDAGPNG
jgi:hypothetical protein